MDNPLGIRDIAPPIETLSDPLMWPWVLAGVLLLAGIILYRLSRKTEPEAVAVPSEPPVSPLQAARLALDALLAEQLIETGRMKQFFTRLNMILRVFLRDQVGIHALFLTTAELLDTCGREQLEAFLRDCDLFKFADITAQAKIARRAADHCRELMETIAKEEGTA